MANKTLLKAAEILETKGWVQGAYRNEEGFCAVGAINQACGLYNHRAVSYTTREKRLLTYYKAVQCLVNYLGARDTGIATIIHFNDSEARSAEQVITTIREAAEVC